MIEWHMDTNIEDAIARLSMAISKGEDVLEAILDNREMEDLSKEEDDVYMRVYDKIGACEDAITTLSKLIDG